MDKKIVNSYISQIGMTKPEHESGRLREKKDSSQDLNKSFSQMLEKEESKAEKKYEKGANERSLVDKQPKGKKELKQQKLDKEIQKQIRKKLVKLSPMLNYLYNLMYKNPDALSLLEKKAAGLDRTELFQRHDVEYKAFKKMLAERGLKLSDLKFNQIAKLAQRNNKSQITAYLDKLSLEKRDGKMVKSSNKTIVEKGKEEMTARLKGNLDVRKTPENMANLREAFKGGKTKQQAQIDKLQKRREVIDQIIKQIDIRNLNNRTELVIKLNPEYMGELKLKIDFEEGRIRANFETTSKEVRKMLKESSAELVEVFNKKGLKLIGTKVKLVEAVE